MPHSVLVVDDNRLMRQMVMRSVQLSGLPVDHMDGAENGAQALDMLRVRKFDLVLLDINMPVMDGEEFLGRLRCDPALSGTRVVVVSTESSPGRISRLRALGARFIHKPFRPEELIAAARGVVEA